jgi:hypothetical protein
MAWLRLLEGPGHMVTLPLAPTMKEITYKGERYNRMPGTRSSRHRSPNCTHLGGCYLWDGWWPQMVAQARLKQAPEAGSARAAKA